MTLLWLLLWIIVWALAGQPPVGGWWIVTLILAALRTMARATGIDEASIDRALKRARRTDELDARRSRATVAA